jgi:hypothetical protein
MGKGVDISNEKMELFCSNFRFLLNCGDKCRLHVRKVKSLAMKKNFFNYSDGEKSDGMPPKNVGVSVSGVPANKNINLGLQRRCI